MKKIVLTGPESTGKSTLAQQLATHFQTKWVPEYARTYIEQLSREYQQDDLLYIARGQLQMEEAYMAEAQDLLFLDTDLVTIKIWSDYRYQSTHPWIEEQLRDRTYDLYLLCTPDIPWVPDPQRENPHDRMDLFNIYKNTLQSFDKKVLEIKGTFEERRLMAIQAVKAL